MVGHSLRERETRTARGRRAERAGRARGRSEPGRGQGRCPAQKLLRKGGEWAAGRPSGPSECPPATRAAPGGRGKATQVAAWRSLGNTWALGAGAHGERVRVGRGGRDWEGLAVPAVGRTARPEPAGPWTWLCLQNRPPSQPATEPASRLELSSATSPSARKRPPHPQRVRGALCAQRHCERLPGLALGITVTAQRHSCPRVPRPGEGRGCVGRARDRQTSQSSRNQSPGLTGEK